MRDLISSTSWVGISAIGKARGGSLKPYSSPGFESLVVAISRDRNTNTNAACTTARIPMTVIGFDMYAVAHIYILEHLAHR